MTAATVRASASASATTGTTSWTFTFPGTPVPGDPVGIWFTTDATTHTVTTPPTGWTLEYSTAVGSGSRTFIHKVYASGDGTSVTVTLAAILGANHGKAAIVVLDGSVHSDFGSIGTVTTRAVAATSSTAVATGSSAHPNLIIFHEKTTGQTSCVVSGATDIQNVLPASGIAGSVYVGTYDDAAGPATFTAAYGLTGNVNGAGYQIPVALVNAAVTAVATWISSTPMHVAHRGGSADWPEHTMFAYDQATLWNKDMALEASCYKSLDGYWVLNHDNDTAVNGIWSGATGNISARNWVGDLQNLRSTVGNYPMIILADLLTKYGNTRILFIDNKISTDLTGFFNILDSYAGRDRYVIKGSGPGDVAKTTAAAARGYVSWGYFYEAGASSIAANANRWTLLGMEYSGTAGAWALAKAPGNPVLAHILPTMASKTATNPYSPSGYMVSGVQEVVPQTPAAAALTGDIEVAVTVPVRRWAGSITPRRHIAYLVHDEGEGTL